MISLQFFDNRFGLFEFGSFGGNDYIDAAHVSFGVGVVYLLIHQRDRARHLRGPYRSKCGHDR